MTEVKGSREALELALRSVFDDDDAVSAAQIVVREGWHPPGLGLTVSNEDFRTREGGRATAYPADHIERVAVIKRERERRHWSFPQWSADAPDEHWPTYIANVRREADAAVDSLIAEIEASYDRETT